MVRQVPGVWVAEVRAPAARVARVAMVRVRVVRVLHVIPKMARCLYQQAVAAMVHRQEAYLVEMVTAEALDVEMAGSAAGVSVATEEARAPLATSTRAAAALWRRRHMTLSRSTRLQRRSVPASWSGLEVCRDVTTIASTRSLRRSCQPPRRSPSTECQIRARSRLHPSRSSG